MQGFRIQCISTSTIASQAIPRTNKLRKTFEALQAGDDAADRGRDFERLPHECLLTYRDALWGTDRFDYGQVVLEVSLKKL